MGEPVEVATLNKDDRGQWKARELSQADLGEPRQMIQTMEEQMRKVSKEVFSAQPTSPIPENAVE